MQNAPKRNAKCTKTQGKMHQNAGQNAPKQQAFCNNMQCTKEPKKCFNRLKLRVKRGKMML